MIKQSCVWGAKAQLILGLFGDQPIEVTLPDIYVVAESYEAALNLLTQNILKMEDENIQFNVNSVYSLARQVYFPADLITPIDENNKEVSINGSTPAKLFKILADNNGAGESVELYAIHETVQLSGKLVSDNSPHLEIMGIAILSNRVFMDTTNYPTAQEKSKDSLGSPNSCYKLLTKEQQANEILKNQTLWAKLIKGYGGRMWGGRYTKALLAAGIKTVGDLALYIMALGLEAIPGQSYGCIFKFANKTPDGKTIMLNPSDLGHYGWKGILTEMKNLDFQWRDYVTNPDDLKFFEETTSDPFD